MPCSRTTQSPQHHNQGTIVVAGGKEVVRAKINEANMNNKSRDAPIIRVNLRGRENMSARIQG